MKSLILRTVMLSGLLSLAPMQASQACKSQVVFEPHLTFEYTSPSDYYVVTIKTKVGDDFDVMIDQSFGGKYTAGTTNRLSVEKRDEANTRCANLPKVGSTYLLRAQRDAEGFQIARFDWGNMPESHENFAGYVADLNAAIGR